MTTNINERNGNTLVVILGPTGSGKTDLSIAVARHFGAPIISTDSRQVYKGMSIGTAQPSPEQLAMVPHHFIASHDIGEHFTSGRYEKEALKVLKRLFSDHKTVVAAGGSGLYIDALCHGMDQLPKSNPSLRSELTERLTDKGIGDLLEELKRLDPEYYGKVDRNNPNRVLRALEVCLQTGQTYTSLRTGNKSKRDFDIIKIGTTMPREELYRRIDLRVDAMMEAGLEQEARNLYPHRQLNSLQTVGYREMFGYFDNRTTREEAVELIKRNSRRYAKRQMTWFGRDEDIAWFDPRDPQSVISHIEKQIVSEK